MIINNNGFGSKRVHFMCNKTCSVKTIFACAKKHDENVSVPGPTELRAAEYPGIDGSSSVDSEFESSAYQS